VANSSLSLLAYLQAKQKGGGTRTITYPTAYME